jgi:signal transduction histidine kinase/DNA-binding NarL/FixJ family response regulator
LPIKKINIPFKVLLSYTALALLIAVVGFLLYNQNDIFKKTESKISLEKNKILKVSNLFSTIYKTESLARKTIQSNDSIDFNNYNQQKEILKSEIDSLKILIKSNYQIKLLDSVQILLFQKSENIKQLKLIKTKQNEALEVKKAITNIAKMEVSLSKLRVEDVASAPEKMGKYQKSVLAKYIAIMNQNIPNDSTNLLSKKAGDSILIANKKLLNKVKTATSTRNLETNVEENKLLQNDLLISEKLGKILNIIEREIILNTTKNNIQKENSLKKTNLIVTVSAIIGLLLSVLFSILILRDFTKTEKYKLQLEIANAKTESLLKNREQLIATVSHDLKTPLSTIVGYTELLGNSDLNKKQEYFTKNIKGSSEYISSLVQDLVDFTQIEAGKITIENNPFSLKDLINEVANSIQSIFNQKEIDLILNIDEKFDRNIIGDSFRLKQILSNIIGNAYKFTENGFIKIDAQILKPNFLILKIEDSGIGIEENNQKLIFEEFTQANENIEKKYGGTGLGLTISKKIIEILGGTLTLKSEIEKGSLFEIQLPFKFSEIHNNYFANRNLTAIIVDDDLSLLNLTSEVLKLNNFKVHSFSDANVALVEIKNIAFDFVITDIQMPKIDGFEFVEKLKNLPEYKNQPVLALTGRNDLETKDYEKAGFIKVIAKPYLPNKLIEIINSVLNNVPIFDISNDEILIENSNKNFSLTTLKQFLSDDKNALKDFLELFKQTTNTNVSDLDKAIFENNFQEIMLISHRMNPVFKQIQAIEITNILDDLEMKQLSIFEIKSNIDILKLKIQELFQEIKTI